MASTYTTNLHLEKPDGNDDISVLAINGNSDILDAALASTNVIRVQRDSNNSYFEYCKTGSIVTLFLYHKVSSQTIEAWATLSFGTLPSGFRPKIPLSECMTTDRQSSIGCALMVNTLGEVYINGRWSGASDTSDIIQASLTFVVA